MNIRIIVSLIAVFSAYIRPPVYLFLVAAIFPLGMMFSRVGGPNMASMLLVPFVRSLVSTCVCVGIGLLFARSAIRRLRRNIF